MAYKNNTNFCLDVGEGNLYITINSVFASLGSLANLVAILLIVWTRSYRQQVYRLTLYLACLGLLHSALIGLETLPVDTSASDNRLPPGTAALVAVRDGWGGTCAAIGFVTQHVGLSKSLAVLWICFFLFMLGLCQVKLRGPAYEGGLLLALALVPGLVSWVPFLGQQYGLIGVWCWIKYDCADPSRPSLGSYYRLGASLIVDIVPHFLSVVFVSAVAIVYCKRSRCDRMTALRVQHWRALKEVSPLVAYPLASSFALLVGTVNNVASHFSAAASEAGIVSRYYVGEMVTLALMQVAHVAIPASFLMHPSVRRNIWSKLNGGSRKKLDEVAKVQESTTVPPLKEEAIYVNEKSPLTATA